MAWRYLASRLHGDGTETLLHPDLPLRDVAITNVLSGPNALTATITPAALSLLGNAVDGLPLFEEWSTVLYAEEDNVLRGAGILTNSGISGPALSLSCLGFIGALKGQPYEGARFFVETEVLDIVRHVIDHWQGMPGGNLGLVLDRATRTGKKIGTKLDQVEFDTQNGPVSFEAGPYKLADYMTDDLAGAIDSLATDYDFDYRETHAWSGAGDNITHRIDFGAPRIGTRRKDIRFVVGENVWVPPSTEVPLDAYASGVLVRGAGDGPTMKRKMIPRSGERRLRRITIVEDKNLKSDAAVAQRGNALLPLLTGQSDITELTVADHDHAPLGSWVEGDEVEALTYDEWTGDGAMWLRILSTTIKPEEAGVATVAVMRADKIPS